MSGFEFTGERVVPGKVEPDLWNEHFARYAFAASQFAAGKRVLDLGCGAGYGSAELARVAASVTGVDIAEEAVAHARAAYPQVRFERAPAQSTGLPDAAFDVVVAFEVIEHLKDWRALLAEAKRLLAPGGAFLVSTPNRAYYAESRGEAGANPFHEHEFECAEFRDALLAFFPAVTMLMQNRVEAFSFHPSKAFPPAAARVDSSGTSETAHFFLAICGNSIESRSFVYVPEAANLLRVRERHIAKLRDEIAMKEEWLVRAHAERDEMRRLHAGLESRIEEQHRWAAKLDAELAEAHGHVERLQTELQTEQAEGRRVAEAYESKVRELERDGHEKAVWAEETEVRLTGELQAKLAELAEAVRLLDQAEATVGERTRWAQGLQSEVEALRARVAAYGGSRWMKLGRAVGAGPRE